MHWSIVAGVTFCFLVLDGPSFTSASRTDLLINNTLDDDEYYALILQQIKKSCGTLCKLDHYFSQRYHSWTPDCQSLLHEPLFHQPAIRWPPPLRLPITMLSDYTMLGKMRVSEGQMLDRTAGASAHWTEEYIEDKCRAVANGTWLGSYNSLAAIDAIRNAVQSLGVTKKHIVVIGSTTPWVECILLNEGAGHVTTLEYGPVVSSHPRLSAIRPYLISEMVKNRSMPSFDGMVTFSSIEHSGLGRYGDLLNPFADAIAIASIWCLTKPKAFMVLGIPSAFATAYGLTDDTIVGNLHRVYGKTRWPYITQHWIPLRAFTDTLHDVAVFEKTRIPQPRERHAEAVSSVLRKASKDRS